MDIQIEPNQRLGQGFQIRAIDGPASEVYDDEPLTMLEALRTLDEITGRAPSKVTVCRAGPEGAPSGPEPEVIVFQQQPDVREAVVDGEKQPVVSARGVILLAWAGWKKSRLEQSRDAMWRYCEYISAHGYRGGASKAMTKLETMSFNHGVQWVKRTFAKYVRDGVALIRYVLPQT